MLKTSRSPFKITPPPAYPWGFALRHSPGLGALWFDGRNEADFDALAEGGGDAAQLLESAGRESAGTRHVIPPWGTRLQAYRAGSAECDVELVTRRVLPEAKGAAVGKHRGNIGKLLPHAELTNMLQWGRDAGPRRFSMFIFVRLA